MTKSSKSGPARTIVHLLQAAAIQGSLWTVRQLPLSWASAFGGFLFRTVGPLLKADKIARRNLQRAFPDWDQATIDATVRQVWDNLGRGAGEFAHLGKIDVLDPNGPVEVVGLEHLIDARDKGAAIFLSAHMANWEMVSLVAYAHDCPLNNIYRFATNPYMDTYFRRVRGRFVNKLLPKGPGGFREAYAGMKRGERLGLLLDQKLNEGHPIPFFGRDAMTAIGPIELGLRLNAPILPVRIERIGKCRFRVTIQPPMESPNSGDLKADTVAVATDFTQRLEGWIRERPGEWFWVHKRWPN